MKSFLFGFGARLSEANVSCGLEPNVMGSRSEQGTAQREGDCKRRGQKGLGISWESICLGRAGNRSGRDGRGRTQTKIVLGLISKF